MTAERRTRIPRGFWAAVWLARLVVAGVFAAAAVPKLLDPRLFALDIAAYDVFPGWSIHWLAAAVPVFELVGAAALVSGYKRRGAALLLGLLDLGFIGLIASALVRGLSISCGCFGAEEAAAAIGWGDLWRDVALLGAIVLAGANSCYGGPRWKARRTSSRSTTS